MPTTRQNAIAATKKAPKPNSGFIALCLELLAPLGAARARAMFGGHGLYLDDVFVAIVADESLFLKVDPASRPRFIAAGGEPFIYTGQGKPMDLGYCTVPAEAMESPALMQPWGRLALGSALAARAKRKPVAAKKAAQPAAGGKTGARKAAAHKR